MHDVIRTKNHAGNILPKLISAAKKKTLETKALPQAFVVDSFFMCF